MQMTGQVESKRVVKWSAISQQNWIIESALRALLAEYGYNLPNVINLLDPKSGRRAPAAEF